jgi:hypothetical protein
MEDFGVREKTANDGAEAEIEAINAGVEKSFR